MIEKHCCSKRTKDKREVLGKGTHISEENWLINSIRSRIKNFSKKEQNELNFLNISYRFFENFLCMGTIPPGMKARKRTKNFST